MSKLLAQWQGLYVVVRPMGKVNYLVDMHDRRKKNRVFHVNMLKEWHVPTSVGYFMWEMSEGEETPPTWDYGDEGEPIVWEQLSFQQTRKLDTLLKQYRHVLRKLPGCTLLATHMIETGRAPPVRLPPYRLPHAFREREKLQLREMTNHGTIKPSRSDWAAPIVLVEKKDKSLHLC